VVQKKRGEVGPHVTDPSTQVSLCQHRYHYPGRWPV